MSVLKITKMFYNKDENAKENDREKRERRKERERKVKGEI